MLLIVAPVAFMANTAATNDNGIATREIEAARMFARNSTTTAMTRIPPSLSARVRLAIAFSMKSD